MGCKLNLITAKSVSPSNAVSWLSYRSPRFLCRKPMRTCIFCSTVRMPHIMSWLFCIFQDMKYIKYCIILDKLQSRIRRHALAIYATAFKSRLSLVSEFEFLFLFDTLSCFVSMQQRVLKCSKVQSHFNFIHEIILPPTCESSLNDEHLSQFSPDRKIL